MKIKDLKPKSGFLSQQEAHDWFEKHPELSVDSGYRKNQKDLSLTEKQIETIERLVSVWEVDFVGSGIKVLNYTIFQFYDDESAHLEVRMEITTSKGRGESKRYFIVNEFGEIVDVYLSYLRIISRNDTRKGIGAEFYARFLAVFIVEGIKKARLELSDIGKTLWPQLGAKSIGQGFHEFDFSDQTTITKFKEWFSRRGINFDEILEQTKRGR